MLTAQTISARKRKFALAKFEGLSHAEAYDRSWPREHGRPRTWRTCQQRGYLMAKDIEVQATMAELQALGREALKGGAEAVLGILWKNATTAERPADSNRASELLGKHHGIFKEDQPNKLQEQSDAELIEGIKASLAALDITMSDDDIRAKLFKTANANRPADEEAKTG